MPDLPGAGRILAEAVSTHIKPMLNIVLDIRQDMYNLESQNQYAQSIYEMKTRFGEFMVDLESNKDYSTFENNWDEAQGNIYEDIAKTITIPEARQRFDAAFYDMESSMRTDVARTSKRIQVEQILSQHTTRFEAFIKNGDVPSALEEIKAMQEGGLIFPHEAAEYRKQAISVGNYNKYYSIAASMPSREGWEWILNPDNAPELTQDQRDRISGDLYNRMTRREAQKQREQSKRTEEAWGRITKEILVDEKHIPKKDIYNRTIYDFPLQEANAAYALQIERDNNLLEAEFKRQEAIAENDLERLEAVLSTKTLYYQLTDQDVTKITALDSGRGEYWRKQKLAQDKRLEEMTKEQREDEEKQNRWWLETSDEFENMHHLKTVDDEINKEDHTRWVMDNINDQTRPWDDERTPHIAAERASGMLGEIDKSYKIDEWGRKSGENIIVDYFKVLTKEISEIGREKQRIAAKREIIAAEAKLLAEYNLECDGLETESEKLAKAQEMIEIPVKDRIKKLLDYWGEYEPELEPPTIEAGRIEDITTLTGYAPEDTHTFEDGTTAYRIRDIWYMWDGDKWIMSNDRGETWEAYKRR